MHHHGKLYCEFHFEDVREKSCDFCGEPDGRWAYDAEMFVQDTIDFGSMFLHIVEASQVWLACDTCRISVDADDAHNLVDRIVAIRGIPTLLPEEGFKEVVLTYFVMVLGAVKRPPTERVQDE